MLAPRLQLTVKEQEDIVASTYKVVKLAREEALGKTSSIDHRSHDIGRSHREHVV